MKKYVIFIFALFVGFASCNKDDDETPTYDLTGTLINTTANTIKNAEVILTNPGETTALYTTQTDGEGIYMFSGVAEGTYELKTTPAGYNETSTEVVLTSDQTVDMTVLGSVNLTGYIINSQTGYGLEGVTLSFSAVGLKGTMDETADVTLVTDEYGMYELVNGPSGTFTLTVSKPGFTERVYDEVILESGTLEIEQITLVETLGEGALRIVLTWGELPYDLDSHLSGPSSTSSERFHCYFSDQEPDQYVNLDVDDTGSYGPETTTINTLVAGTYRFSVHNYSEQSITGSQGIYDSPAKVELFDETGLVATFAPPAVTDGNTWRVFEVESDGTNYTITTLGTYQQFDDYSVIDGMGQKPAMKNDGTF